MLCSYVHAYVTNHSTKLDESNSKFYLSRQMVVSYVAKESRINACRHKKPQPLPYVRVNCKRTLI